MNYINIYALLFYYGTKLITKQNKIFKNKFFCISLSLSQVISVHKLFAQSILAHGFLLTNIHLNKIYYAE